MLRVCVQEHVLRSGPGPVLWIRVALGTPSIHRPPGTLSASYAPGVARSEQGTDDNGYLAALAAGRRILFVHGERDLVAPMERIQAFHRALLPCFAGRHHDIGFQEHRRGHGLPPASVSAVVAWLAAR